MVRKFVELTEKMSPASRARSDAKFEALIREMPLHELRRARGLSQKALAALLHIEQPAIAKLEWRADMYISSLRAHIEAMHGELEIIARFPSGAVTIKNFTALEFSET